jgi:hypothetical protein
MHALSPVGFELIKALLPHKTAARREANDGGSRSSGARISSRITTVIRLGHDHPVNWDCCTEPFAVSPAGGGLLLRHAWLSP